MIQVLCKEKGGPKMRTAELMVKDVPQILRVMDKIKTVPNFLGKEEIQNYHAFLAPDTFIYLVDDVGLAFFKPVEGYLAEAHITFWDGRLRGREDICRAIGRDFLELRGVSQGTLLTAIPADRGTVIAFARRVGFRSFHKVLNYEMLKWTLNANTTVVLGGNNGT